MGQASETKRTLNAFIAMWSGQAVSLFGSRLVITSYSIHYTKLYEAGMERADGHGVNGTNGTNHFAQRAWGI